MYVRTFPFLVSDQLTVFGTNVTLENEDTWLTLDANAVVASEDIDND